MLRDAKPKYAVFLSYQLDNHHSQNFRAFIRKRPTYSPEISPQFRQRLPAQDLLLE